MPSSMPPLSDPHVRATAVEILGRAPYAEWREREARAAWLEALVGWLRGVDGWLLDLSASAPLLYWLIVGAALAVAALLFAHVVWSLRVALAQPSGAGRSPALPPGPSLAAAAERLAAEGRYLDAAHRLQLATIELMLQRRIIALSRFEPNRVLRERLRTAPLPSAERRALLGLVDRLEACWFRDRANDPALYGEWHALHRRLSDAVR